MITEKQAWNKIAESFEAPWEQKTPEFGLCAAIKRLFDAKEISPEDNFEMQAKILRYKKANNITSLFIWRTFELGSRAKRANLAREFAAELPQLDEQV
jgi:hypothetical protein